MLASREAAWRLATLRVDNIAVSRALIQNPSKCKIEAQEILEGEVVEESTKDVGEKKECSKMTPVGDQS
jgi:hypothetical protein